MRGGGEKLSATNIVRLWIKLPYLACEEAEKLRQCAKRRGSVDVSHLCDCRLLLLSACFVYCFNCLVIPFCLLNHSRCSSHTLKYETRRMAL